MLIFQFRRWTGQTSLRQEVLRVVDIQAGFTEHALLISLANTKDATYKGEALPLFRTNKQPLRPLGYFLFAAL